MNGWLCTKFCLCTKFNYAQSFVYAQSSSMHKVLSCAFQSNTKCMCKCAKGGLSTMCIQRKFKMKWLQTIYKVKIISTHTKNPRKIENINLISAIKFCISDAKYRGSIFDIMHRARATLTTNCTHEISPIVQCFGPTSWDFVSDP